MNSTKFKCISTRESDWEVGHTLKTTYEDTNIIKVSKLQKLTKNFENLNMENDMSFDGFYEN